MGLSARTGVFTGTATTNFTMTDFGLDPPEFVRTLKAENGVIVELKIEAQRAVANVEALPMGPSVGLTWPPDASALGLR